MPAMSRRLDAAASKAMESAPIRERLAGEALRTIFGPPEVLQRQMAKDMAQWGGIIRDRSMTLD
jgi:tripartite-type tricarboxylate transporter receptor subunit TctC